MTVTDRVRALVEPLLTQLDLELFDVEQAGGVLRVTVDRPGGVDLIQVAEATRAVSRALDDNDPLPGRYTLEVTSPGLERKLRTPAHFRGAVGSDVTIKLVPGVSETRRLAGVLVGADDETVVIADGDGDEQRIPYDQIERARTVFEWGPQPKPGRRGGADRKATA